MATSSLSSTYDHRLVRTGHPVRSAILKHQIGRSVVGWVTTSESLLLYVFCFVAGSCGVDGARMGPAMWWGGGAAADAPGLTFGR